MTNPADPLEGFDPDAPASGSGIYGLPHTQENAGVILLPVPWEGTVSYGSGTSGAPAAILEASRQVDLFDRETARPYRSGIYMLPIPEEIRSWSGEARNLASRERVDALGESVNRRVYEASRSWLDRGRLVGVIGGDHSSPFGLIRALAERRPGLGILHLDAHADLRQAYEGFRWSHASIFWNVLEEIPGVARIVQAGVRDYGSNEDALIRGSAGRVYTFFEADLRRRVQEGTPWTRVAAAVIESLPEEVYVSFDIDALDPSLCPHTGTPVPGGFTFAEAVSLLRLTAESGRRIAGFDLCEVAPDPGGSDWDANVGARILYKLIGFALKSRERA